MIRAAVLGALLLLAACGADGAPQPVEQTNGVSGHAKIGVVGSF